MKNALIALIVVGVMAVGGWYVMNMNQESAMPAMEAMPEAAMETSATPEPTSTMESETPTQTTTGTAPAKTASVKEFTVDGKNFSFLPATLSVKKGDTVKLKFVNVEGFHDFVIDEFKVATPKIREGEATVEFVADKAGTFEYYCSVGSHRAMGMKGTLTVTE